MQSASCPNCGAEIRFRSVGLPVRVCDFCRSTVLRRGEQLELAGKAATVPEDVSPIQIGTTGADGARRFEVIGRVRWRWSDGAWSEWLLLFGDGSHGWLGEASGRWMLLRQVRDPAGIAGLAQRMRDDQVIPGMSVTIAGLDYEVNDARTVECVGSEGELPYPAPAGLKAVSVDLLRADGGCASVQREGEGDAAEVFAYAGRYVRLAEIAPRNLRWIEGWTAPDFAR